MNPNHVPPGDAGIAEGNCYLPPEPFSDDPDLPPDAVIRGQPLALRHVRQLTNGTAFATAQGSPLTVHVTFHLRLAEGFTPESWSEFQTDLFDKMSRWLKRRGVPVAFVWTREDGSRKGPHVHALVHLPQAHWPSFKRYMLSAGRFQQCDAGGEAIVISAGRFGMQVETMRAGALRYILKSLDASADTLTTLGLRPHSTKPVPIQRCGVSTSIGRKARKEAGWIEKASFPELASLLHPANDNVAEANLHVA